MTSIFLSHSHRDKLFVRRLAQRLTQSGVVVWLDEVHLEIGHAIIDKVADAINTVDYVAAVISKHSVRSRWVRKELSLAMSKEIGGKRMVVLPVLIDDSKIPHILGDKLYADFRDKTIFEASSRQLLRAIGVVSAVDTIGRGMWIEWQKQAPRLVGRGVVISTSESAGLLDRWNEWLPVFLRQEQKKGFEAANLLAVLRACIETYKRVPNEREMKEFKTELARKFDLFFAFTMHMATIAFSKSRSRVAIVEQPHQGTAAARPREARKSARPALGPQYPLARNS